MGYSLKKTFNKATFCQFYYGTFAMITFMSPGMHIGYSAVSLPSLTNNETLGTTDNMFHNNPNAGTWFASLLGISGPFGCLLGTFCMKAGRKIPMALVGFGCTAAWLLIATSYGIEQILIGRFIGGIATGLVSAPTVVYLAEISTPKYRLSLMTGTTLFMAIGIMLIYLIGYLIPSWRLQAAISTIIPLLSALSMLLLMPESPVWLLHQNRQADAKEALMKLRGLKEETSEFCEEFNQMLNNCKKKIKEIEITTIPREIGISNMNREIDGVAEVAGMQPSPCHARTKIIDVFRIMKLSEVWKPFIILNAMFFFLQFCGIPAIFAYSVDIVTRCGLSADPFLITAIIGFIQLLACILLVATSSRLGARTILLISTAGMAISLGVLGIYLQFVKEDQKDNYEIIARICLFIFVGTGSYGIIAMPWSMVGELYPTEYIHYLAPITTCMGNIYNFVALFIYPIFLHLGIASVIYFYCFISIIAVIFVALALPETRGVPHHEIVANFRKKRMT